MTGEEALARIRSKLQQTAEETPAAKALIEKIRSGKATYADTSLYARWAAINLGMSLSDVICDIDLSDRAAVCKALLLDQYEDINGFIDMVQAELDSRFGIQLAPHRAPFNDERADTIGYSLADTTKPDEVIRRRARSATETAVKSIHDDRMKSEAKFRHSAGLDCRIIRVAVNGCCPWCSDVAGRYRYGEEPDDIYKRHDNCDCTVTFENGRKRQDVWSKREWEAPEPGAGAGEPVVLTKEQAAAVEASERVVLTKEQAATIEAKHHLSYLTGGAKSGTMKLAAIVQCPPDFSKYELHSDPDAVRKTEKLIIDMLHLSAERVSLEGIQNADALKPFVLRLGHIVSDTGMSISSIRAVDIIDGDPTCIAGYKPGEGTLYISSRFFNSKPALIDTLREWASSGIMPKQAKSIAFLAEHEAAHIRIPDELLETDDAVKLWRKRKLNSQNDEDIYEYFADVVAIFRLNTATTDQSILSVIEFLRRGGVTI